MHLIKTQEGSQFYRFHDNSAVAKDCLTSGTPMINDRRVEILQVAYLNGGQFNVLVEFIYVKEK